jgi:ABC-type transport system involved in cytochrome bd biosynthesis fused ATPase/permease subunit
MMKKIMIPMMIVAFLIPFYEQQKANSNVYITVGAIAVFMYGMMRLSAKTPSKNQDKEEENV